MKHYKAIFLDWDDTIGDWTHAEHLALQDIYAMYHLDELYGSFDDYLAAYKPYNLQLWGQYGRGEVSKEKLHFERFYQPLKPDEGSFLSKRDKTELAHEMGSNFLQLTNKYFSLLPDADRVVRYLASKYPLTIVSNGFKEVQYYKFAHSGLQDYFAYTVISDEIGINKPQPGIFRVALELNGLQASEVVMIGDSYTSDVAGAKAAGIDQIWLRASRFSTDETATYTVPRLTDVMTIL